MWLSAAMAAWLYKDFVADARSRVRELSCEELARRLEGRDRGLVLDVREAAETSDGSVPGAVLLPRGLVEKHIHEHVPGHDTAVYVLCSTGNRSLLVGDVLQKMGYADVWSVAGGIERWRHLGLPVSGSKPAVCLINGGRLDWDDVRREFAIVARKVPVLGSGERELVYLDHAASTHAPESVLAAYLGFLQHEYANIHRGTHLLSRKATERFEETYYIIADFIGAELKHGAICFTANTTQSVDLASHVMAHVHGKVVTTEMEHHSNELPHRKRGTVLRARIGNDGLVDLGHLEELLRRNEVKLVAITGAANVTGLMPDLGAVARLAHDNGALLLADAAQLLAHRKIDVKPFDHPEHIDFLAGAGHKAYAPFGSGFLYGPRALLSEAPPYLPGGGTAARVTAHGTEFLAAPDRHHGGTPNIAGVVGMARALLFLQSIGMDAVRQHEIELTRLALDGMRAMGGVTVYGNADPESRLGVISFNVDGVSDLMTAAVLSEEGGLAVRNGRFCAHLYMDRLLQIQHEGQTGEVPAGAVRASFGLYNTKADVDRLLEYVKRVRDHKWVGHYRVKNDTMTAEFAGRCADRWMEATQEATTASPQDGATDKLGYVFEVLQPEGACRSYLVADASEKVAAVVDPLRERVDDYLNLLQARGLTLLYTIETHTHADHLSGSARLKDLTGAKMLMHAESPAPCVDAQLRDGDVIAVGGVRMEVLATPGHTRDGVCLLLPGRVLTGDTLLIGGCGRTDLPTGDPGILFGSLRRLMELPDETLVFPAHDYKGQRASTIGRERRTNKRVLIGSTEEFSAEMGAQKLAPPQRLVEALEANLHCR
jgi:cysteine desulfurase / selenocysteine lyase